MAYRARYGREPPGHVEASTLLTLDLAAGCARHCAGANEHKIEKPHAVIESNRVKGALRHGARICDSRGVVQHFVHGDDLLLIVRLDRKCGPHGTEPRMAGADRSLDLLRVQIAAPMNDQVLAPPGDVELALPFEAEVTGTHE